MIRLDFTKQEHEDILANAGLTKRQREIYQRLRDDFPYERQSIVKIASEMYIGTATVSREIRRIQFKLIRFIK